MKNRQRDRLARREQYHVPDPEQDAMAHRPGHDLAHGEADDWQDVASAMV